MAADATLVLEVAMRSLNINLIEILGHQRHLVAGLVTRQHRGAGENVRLLIAFVDVVRGAEIRTAGSGAFRCRRNSLKVGRQQAVEVLNSVKVLVHAEHVDRLRFLRLAANRISCLDFSAFHRLPGKKEHLVLVGRLVTVFVGGTTGVTGDGVCEHRILVRLHEHSRLAVAPRVVLLQRLVVHQLFVADLAAKLGRHVLVVASLYMCAQARQVDERVAAVLADVRPLAKVFVDVVLQCVLEIVRLLAVRTLELPVGRALQRRTVLDLRRSVRRRHNGRDDVLLVGWGEGRK